MRLSIHAYARPLAGPRLQGEDRIRRIDTVKEGRSNERGDEADGWYEEGGRDLDNGIVAKLCCGGQQMAHERRAGEIHTGGSLLATIEAVLATKTVAPQTIKAIVGRKSNSLGHSDR